MQSLNFTLEAEAMRDELVARRRDFHRYPELAFEEQRTAGIVAQELNALGLEVQAGVGKTGVVAVLEGAHDGPTVLVRADMDALPIHEENAVEYASTTAGKMHACGHDGHVTIALAVAKLFSARREDMAGRIKFVFQPAEEVGKGARAMVEDGVLSDPKPDVSLGLHLWNSMPVGTVAMTEGPIMAGASIFDIRVAGKGGHAAAPHQNIDPVACAAHLVTMLQTVVSRNVDPLDGAVITVTYLRAGDAYNVTPQEVHMRGTFRTFKPEVRALVVRRMQEITESVCSAMNCQGEVKIQHITEPVVNDSDVVHKVRGVFGDLVGEQHVDLMYQTMTAEDMGALMTTVPGLFFFVGAADPTADAYYGHHHPRFSFSEDALPLAVALMSSAVAAYVLPE